MTIHTILLLIDQLHLIICLTKEGSNSLAIYFDATSLHFVLNFCICYCVFLEKLMGIVIDGLQISEFRQM